MQTEIESNKVAVVTINYNQTSISKACIDSLLCSSYKNFEIIVIDNGSSVKEYTDLKDYVDHNVDTRIR